MNGDRPPTTIKSKRLVEVADLNRREKKQARGTIIEVESLERMLNDEKEELADRYAAGSFLFCLYSRSRLSDLRKVRGFMKDVSESNGAIYGYIECRTRSHKTSRLVAHQGLAMPLIAPVWGLLAPWGLNFLRVAAVANRTLENLFDEPMLPAPALGQDLAWQNRSVTTTEAGKWLRSLLSKVLGEIEYTTVHSLKATPLSWCAKAGLEPDVRLLLGHHVTGKKSADVYARDVLAAPLRQFDLVLQQIRNGSLRPDSTRSGMLGKETCIDPKESYVHHPDQEDDQTVSSSSTSTSTSEGEDEEDDQHLELALPLDPVAEAKNWDPDFDMFQHRKSQIVHLRASGSTQPSFSCGIKMSEDFEKVSEVNFLLFRKCKRCAAAKPIKDVGALASALKKQRIERESSDR